MISCPPAGLQVRKGLFPGGRLNADAVGQHAQKLAKMWGLDVPEWAKVIIGEVGAGKTLTFSEVLAPNLPNFAECCPAFEGGAQVVIIGKVRGGSLAS